jgi:hypothetical protein
MLLLRHRLMRACWMYSPGDRITFRSIVDQLVSYESEGFRSHAYYHTQPKPAEPVLNLNNDDEDGEEDLLLDEDDDEQLC